MVEALYPQYQPHHSHFAVRWYFFLPLLLAIVVHISHDQCHAVAAGSLSPIGKTWQDSWTASQASSTVMSMVYEDCIVIFFRSPASDIWTGMNGLFHDLQDVENPSRNLHGLEVLDVDPATLSSHTQHSPPFIVLSNNGKNQFTICAMTGLAVDVDHLYRVIQNTCENDNILRQYNMATTHRYARHLAFVLQKATLSSGRPYGVQVLFAGCDGVTLDDGDDSQMTSSSQPSSPMCLYSMDPSGTISSWMKGTAIGKFGPELRHVLGKKIKLAEHQKHLNIEGPLDKGLEGVVECMIQSWKEVCHDQNLNVRDDNDEQYSVVILKQNPGKSQSGRRRPTVMHTVPRRKVYEIVDRVNKMLQRETISGT